MTIGESIKQLRHSEGMTVQTLSILTGLSERFINFIEHDKKKPSLRSLTRIADAVDRNMTITYSPGQKVTNVNFLMRDILRPKSFDERIEQLEARLLQDCIRLCRYNKSEGENLSQEAIMQALLYHYRYNEQSQLYTWLFGIAKNINRVHYGKDKNLTFVDEFFETAYEEPEIKEMPHLSKYLNRLSPRAKQIYKLRLIGKSYADIAQEIGITESGAKSWFWTIKGNIKKIINN